MSAKRYTPSSRSRRKKRKLQKKALQRKQDGGGEDAAVEDKEEATTACNKRNVRKKRMRARRREQEGDSEARKKKKLEETCDEKCDEKTACENLAEPSCRLSMKLAGGMQHVSQTSWNINIVRQAPPIVEIIVKSGLRYERSLSLQGATRARKVARAMKDAERARQEAEPQTVEEETKSFTRGRILARQQSSKPRKCKRRMNCVSRQNRLSMRMHQNQNHSVQRDACHQTMIM